MPDAANATASLKIILDGISDVNKELQALEDRLTRLQGLSGTINLGGGSGGGGHYISNAPGGVGVYSGIAASDVVTGRGGRTAGPSNSGQPFNTPSASSAMDIDEVSILGSLNTKQFMQLRGEMSSGFGGPLYDAVASQAGRMGWSAISSQYPPMNGQDRWGPSPPGPDWYGPPGGYGFRSGMNPMPPSPMGALGNGGYPGAPALPWMAGSGAPNWQPYYGMQGPPPPPNGGGGGFIGPMQPPPDLGGVGNQSGFMSQLTSGFGGGGGAGGGLLSLIGLHFMLRQLEASGAAQNQLYAASTVGGQPYYGEAFVPSTMQQLSIGAGAALGATIGQPVVGGFLGGMVGLQVSTAIEPYVQRDIAQTQVQFLYGNNQVANVSQPMLDLARQRAMSGQPIPAELLSRLASGTAPMNGAQQTGIQAANAGIAGAVGIMAGISASAATPVVGLGVGAGAFAAVEAGLNAAESAVWAKMHHVDGIFSGELSAEDSRTLSGKLVSQAADPRIERMLGSYQSRKYQGNDLVRQLKMGAVFDPEGTYSILEGMSTDLENPERQLTGPLKDILESRALSNASRMRGLGSASDIAGAYFDVGRGQAQFQGTQAVARFWSSGGGAAQLSAAQGYRDYFKGSGDIADYSKYDAAVQGLQLQARMDALQSQVQNAQSFGDLAVGIQSNSLNASLMSGADPFSVSTGDLSKTMMAQAGDFRRIANGLPLNSPQRAQLLSQANDIDFRANYVVPKGLEDSRIASATVSLSLSQAPGLGAAQFASMAGPASGAGGFAGAQADALREQASLMRDIAQNAQFRTDAERKTYELSAMQAENQARILDYQKQILNAQGSFNISTTGNMETSTRASIALIMGAGGAQASAAYGASYGAALSNVRAAQTLVSQVGDPNSPEGLQARQTLAQAQEQAAVAREAQANVPYGGFVQAQRYGLQAQQTALEAGLVPGTPGEIRRNMASQMSIIRTHIGDIDKGSANLAQREGGHLDAAQAADFARQRAEAIGELTDISKQYNFGYMDRLISMAYNLPQNAWYAKSQLSNREASLAGIMHPSIGGTQSQIRTMAAIGYDLRNIASAPGAGSAAGFNQMAAGAANGAIRLPTVVVPVEVSDSRNGNVLSRNDVIIENGRTSQSVSYRVPIATRPPT